MIRPAIFSDTPAILALLRSSHERSKYAGRTDLNERAMEQLVLGMIAGQRQTGPDATFAVVATNNQKVVGFMLGMLNRVYGIANKLVANDLFLINEGKSMTATMKMIDAYIDWASKNPKVLEIGLSWSDTVGGGETMAKIYQRKGFKLAGEQYELRMDVPQVEAA